MVGILLGFLFGIPRILTRSGATVATPAPPSPPANANQQQAAAPSPPANADRPESHSGVNTNLEEISDWLTKIIVGVSLVELQKAQAKLQEAAGFIAGTLGGTSQTSFSCGLMVYFSVAGFLGSYLLTRLYLQTAFKKAASGE
jgi:hypothetical protein